MSCHVSFGFGFGFGLVTKQWVLLRVWKPDGSGRNFSVAGVRKKEKFPNHAKNTPSRY